MLLGVVVAVVAILALRQSKSGVVGGTDGRSTTIVRTITNSSSQPSTPRTSASTPPSTSASTSTATSASSAANGAKAVPLIVLNNTTVHGLASTAASRFRSGGWTVTRVDNLVNNIVSTCAYYDPNAAGAQAAAEALQQQFPAIRRVQPRFAELPSGPIVVVLTPDYPGG